MCAAGPWIRSVVCVGCWLIGYTLAIEPLSNWVQERQLCDPHMEDATVGHWTRTSISRQNLSACADVLNQDDKLARQHFCVNGTLRSEDPHRQYTSWEWRPATCRLPPAPKGRRVLVVGDSLARQFWEAMVCFHGPHSAVQKVSVPFLWPEMERTDLPKFRLPAHKHHKHGHKLIKHEPMNVVPVNVLKALKAPAWDAIVVLGMTERLRTATTHGVVVRSNGTAMSQPEVFEAVRRLTATWCDVVSRLQPTSTLVWLSPLPEHFDGDFAAGGKCESRPSPPPVPAYSFNELHGWRDWIPNLHRSLASGILGTARAKVLNVTGLARYRSDAHPGLVPSHQGRVYDCLHWCIGSGVMESIVAITLASLGTPGP